MVPLSACRVRVVALLQGLVDRVIVVILKNASLVGIVQGSLEVLRDLLLAELLLHTVDDRHDPLDVPVEHVTLLQALGRYGDGGVGRSWVLLCVDGRRDLPPWPVLDVDRLAVGRCNFPVPTL